MNRKQIAELFSNITVGRGPFADATPEDAGKLADMLEASAHDDVDRTLVVTQETMGRLAGLCELLRLRNGAVVDVTPISVERLPADERPDACRLLRRRRQAS